MNSSNAIAFILPSAQISGGNNVILNHGLGLKERGWTVYCLTHLTVNPRDLTWFPDAERLTWLTIDEFVRNAVPLDIAMSTFWSTNFLLSQIPAKRYCYFVQSVESRFYPKDDSRATLCESSYKLPVSYLTIATWIKKYLGENFRQNSHLVLNGINKKFFNTHGPAIEARSEGKTRFLIEGALGIPFKNTEKTIELVRKATDSEIWLITNSDIKSYQGVDRVFSKIPILKTAEIYRSCDVLVKLSLVEGMFGPPLEMFHCGGTCIVYDVTGADEYIENLMNGIVVKMGDEKSVIDAVRLIEGNPQLLARLKAGAIETAKKWPSWPDSSANFEKSLMTILNLETQPADVIRSALREYSFLDREHLYQPQALGVLSKIKRFVIRNPFLFKMIYPIYQRATKRGV